MNMNKPYFAKYLPVEGEINNNNIATDGISYYKWIENTNPALHKKGHYEPIGEYTDSWYNEPDGLFRKVKLFLCSRDIQVGDTLRTLTGKETIPVTGIGGGEMETLQIGINNKQLFKVIGEISPEATWVKEGDEFDDYDYRYKDENGWDIIKDISLISEPFRHLYKIGLKGPCGHFH